MVEFLFRTLNLRERQILGKKIRIFFSKRGEDVKVLRYLFMSRLLKINIPIIYVHTS